MNQSFWQKLCKLILMTSVCTIMAGLMGCASKNNFSEIANYVDQHSHPRINTVPYAALVAIRWPAKYDDSAIEILSQKARASNAEKGRDLPISFYRNLFSTQAPDTATYYALSLYHKFLQVAPNSEILLEPELITYVGGVRREVQLNQVPPLPTAFTIDIKFTPPAKELGYPPNKFSPLFSIFTGGVASPKTCGLVAISGTKNPSLPLSESTCLGMSSRRISEEYSNYVNNTFVGNVDNAPAYIEGRFNLPFKPNDVVIYDWVINLMPDVLKQRANPMYSMKSDPNGEAMLTGYSAPIAEASISYDLNKATQASMIEYVAEYDSQLSSKLALESNLSNEDNIKLAAIKKMAEIEKKWISKHTEELVYKLLDGPYGKSFRATRYAAVESDLITQKAIAQADRENALKMLTGAASSGLLSGHGAANAVALAKYAVKGMAEGINNTATIKNINDQDFSAMYNSEFDARNQVMDIEIAGKTMSITAKDWFSLRNKLKIIYNETTGH